MKQVLVTLNKGVDYAEFWDQLERDTTTDPSVDSNIIPDRTVDVSNRKPLSNRTTEYVLSDDEIARLKTDPRVMGIDQLPPPEAKQLFAQQSGFFARSSVTTSTHINWALRRCTQSAIESVPGDKYPYNLDGTGVDVVIQDNGVMSGHPDFQDADGNTRLVEHNWYTAAGQSGSMSSNHYGDVGNHGTHVASTAAGKLYGWAKNASIYSIRFDSGGGIADGDEFDLIRLWHNLKPVTSTGYKKPTIVNASWGYRWYYPGRGASGSVTDLVYRGSSVGTTLANQYGNRGSYHNIYGVTSIDAACEDLTDAGVIYVKAAGNYYHKQDVPSGADYDNHYKCSATWTYFSAGTPIYYHRPGSPHSSDSIVVGNVYSSPNGTTSEAVASSSEKGPRIDCFAPGSHITAATNSTGYSTNTPYPGNSSYNSAKISGTSMASPQVCGILALFLQVNPHATANDCKKFLQEHSQAIMDTGDGSGTDYTDNSSTQGGPNRFLYMPWNSSNVLTIS